MNEESRTSFGDLQKRKQELLSEIIRIDEQLLPKTMERLVLGAAQIADFGAPDAPILAGSLLHAARCLDDAGRRLRRALGHTIYRSEDKGRTDPVRLVLVLWTEPRADDVRLLRELGLAPAFPEGRWRPCAVFVGEAQPEALAELVLRYGGEVHALLREKKARGSRNHAAAS